MLHRTLILFGALCVFTGATAARAAEKHFDFYGGITFAEDRSTSASIPATNETERRTPNYDDDSLSIGARFGIWSDRAKWLGFHQDISYFEQHAQGVEIEVQALTSMLMFRAPIGESEEFPYGRFYPYFGAGLSLYYATVQVDYRPALSQVISNDTVDIGFQAVAGVTFYLTPRLALFGEYRFTRYDMDVEDRDDSQCVAFVCATESSFDTLLEAHHFHAGLSIRF